MKQLALKQVLKLAGCVRIGLRQSDNRGARFLVVDTFGKDLECFRANPKPFDSMAILFLTHHTPPPHQAAGYDSQFPKGSLSEGSAIPKFAWRSISNAGVKSRRVAIRFIG